MKMIEGHYVDKENLSEKELLIKLGQLMEAEAAYRQWNRKSWSWEHSVESSKEVKTSRKSNRYILRTTYVFILRAQDCEPVKARLIVDKPRP